MKRKSDFERLTAAKIEKMDARVLTNIDLKRSSKYLKHKHSFVNISKSNAKLNHMIGIRRIVKKHVKKTEFSVLSVSNREINRFDKLNQVLI